MLKSNLVSVVLENPYFMEVPEVNFTTHKTIIIIKLIKVLLFDDQDKAKKSAHNSVHNLQFFIRLTDGVVKMGNSD